MTPSAISSNLTPTLPKLVYTSAATTYIPYFIYNNLKDTTLRHINVTSSTDIPYHFYSLHSYRRGAQGNTTRKREDRKRKSPPHEPNDHAHWRACNTGQEDMPTHYREPSVEDRVFE